LSSDGLHGLVSVNTIEDILKRQLPPEQTGQELLQTALENGGKDNITIIVIHV
jgi:serine/threonine protein phosphatase PrpC